jgi:hypothetical protein
MSVTAEFRSKQPHKTCWLRIEWQGVSPLTLFDALAAAGWVACPMQPLTPIAGRCWRDFQKPGTGVFNGWVPAERTAHLAAARRVLRRYGLTRVPTRRLTLHDLL